MTLHNKHTSHFIKWSVLVVIVAHPYVIALTMDIMILFCC